MTSWTARPLLELDPSLGRDLAPEDFAAASKVSIPIAALPAGVWNPRAFESEDIVRGPAFGVLVLEGMVTSELELLGRISARLHGPGDQILFPDEGLDPLRSASIFRAECASALAVFDDRTLAIGARWPRIAGRMYRAAADHAHRATLHHAIAQLPRIEDRLLALFIHLAQNWGRAHPGGVVVVAPLTHDALGRMVGARRPTVSLALKKLTENGAVRRSPDGWLLASDAHQRLKWSTRSTVRAAP